MKRFLLIPAFMLVMLASRGQQVKVIDQTDLTPIEHATVQNIAHTRHAITASSGVTYIGDFSETDTLIFQHTSYYPLVIPYRDLAGLAFTVKMAERSIRLKELIVSASKWEQNQDEVPNRILGISAKDIAFGNPQTTADLIGQTGEVFVQKSQQGGGSPMIRGFSANSLLIVVDGVRMNNAIYRSGNLQNVNSIDALMLESAEVIFGPGTVIYGSDALGGVMDFHTRSVRLATESKSFSSASWMTRYASANQERTTHLDVNIASGKWGSLTSFTGSWFSDLKMGKIGHSDYRRPAYATRIDGKDVMMKNPDPDKQLFTGYEQFNLMQKVLFRPVEHAEFQYAFHFSNMGDVPRYDRLIQYNPDSTQRYAEWHYGPQNWMLHSLSGKWMKSNRAFDLGKFVAAYQRYEESRHSRRYGKDNILRQWENVDVMSLNLDFEKDLSSHDYLFYGAEMLYNDVKSVAEEENILLGSTRVTGPRYPDGKNHYTTLSAYVNYKHNFSDRATLLGGIRYNFVSLNSTIADTSLYHFPFDVIDLSNSALNGSVGFTWHPQESWQFNVNLATGFRAPNLDDVGKVFDSEPGSVVVPNTGLKPEHAYNLDLAFMKDFKGKARLEIAAFYTLLRDAMVRGDFTFNGKDSIVYLGELSRVQAVVNADGAYVYGANIAVEVALSSLFSVKSLLNYTYGEDDAGNSIRHAPPVFGSTHLVFRREKFRSEIYAVYNGVIPYERLTPTERDKPYMYAKDKDGNPFSPAWWTLNLKSTYQISQHFSIDLGFENLLDHRYRPYSSGIAAAGRSIYLTLRGNL